MDLKDIANELVAACREGREADVLTTLYDPDAVSVEAADNGNGRETKGVAGIQGKHDWWAGAMEVTAGSVSDPKLHGEDRFAVIFQIRGRVKETGDTFDMEEVALYTVANGKIVREEFFY